MPDTAYAVVADVQALINTSWHTITADTVPTTTRVQTWLNQYAARIDSILARRGYSTVPTTGANDLLMINPILAGRVAYNVWNVVSSGMDVPSEVQAWLTEWEAWIADMQSGEIGLIDQTTRTRIRTIQAQVYGSDSTSDTLEDWMAWQDSL